jgi:FdrA protein
MPVRSLVKTHLYKDSVSLMRIAEALSGLQGVRYATLLMGTGANKQLLEQARRLTAEVQDASPDDLMIVLEADSEVTLDAGVARAEHLLADAGEERGTAGVRERPPQSLGEALGRVPRATLAQISTPGPYAAAEALKALCRGLHVFLFSDNVPLEQEIFLKGVAKRKGLLVMGPDCGTALIGGIPLGFANVVRRGAIGLVAASGTGLQQVTCLIHRFGGGVSHGIGTGSRDLSEAVGGVTFGQALDLLQDDRQTRVIVLISKPPAPSVAARILDRVQGSAKPVVVLFLGGAPEPVQAAGATPVSTLAEAASTAVTLAGGVPSHTEGNTAVGQAENALAQGRALSAGQCYVRGLFSGGTFCSEAQVVWRQMGLVSHSNVPLEKAYLLPDLQHSRQHTAIDMGSDEFTVGRPHPMIDFRYRIERILREAADPTTAVILLDIVLGFGAHSDPAAALAPVLRDAHAAVAREGRHLIVVGSVCGTEEDPQRLSAQEARLRDAGMLLTPSNAAAAWLAAAIATRGAAIKESR